ncbi:hypothetical protein GGR58DRAFT_509252 [Xylaria digitata]|nr:hypothetical protein GGR58DRAFT_509252 [Xylaria digitata]
MVQKLSLLLSCSRANVATELLAIQAELEDKASLSQQRLERIATVATLPPIQPIVRLPPIFYPDDRTYASGNTLNEESTPTQTKVTHTSTESRRIVSEHSTSALRLPTAEKRAESELRVSRQNEFNERQAIAAIDIRNRLEGIGTERKVYFPVGASVISFDELWQCKYSGTTSACTWMGRFPELASHFAISHHIFQDAGPDAKWTICLICNTPTPGWGPLSKCPTHACSTSSSRQKWYWGSLVKAVGTPGELASSPQSLEKIPLPRLAEQKEESRVNYADTVKDKTRKTSSRLTEGHPQYASGDANSQSEIWTTNLTRLQSAAYPSSASDFTKSTNKSDATPHTSVPSGSSYTHFQKGQESVLLGIQEEEAHMIKDDTVQGTSTEELPDPVDNVSTVSLSSTEYSPHQKDDAILRFTQAMLERLPENLNYVVVNETSRQQLLHRLRLALKEFAVAVEAVSNNNTHRRGIRMVRRLRQEIASRIHDEVLSLNQATENSRDLLIFTENLPSITMRERVRDWTANIDIPVTIDNQNPHMYQDLAETMPGFSPSGSPSPTNSSVAIGPGPPGMASLLQAHLTHSPPVDLYGNSVDPAEVMDYFTKQSAFDNLIDETERLFERYHGQKMNLIRQRTSLALRRHPEAGQKFSAFFSVDWALADFLINNYDAGRGQKLNHILATTGGSETAIMCTVGEYMTWCWPSYDTQLLHVIETVLCSSNSEQKWYRICAPGATRRKEPDGNQKANNSPLDVPISQYISADSTLRRFQVEGTEDFVISIAQQLSWLAAAYQEKSKTCNHAYVGFSQVAGLSTVEFEIDITLELPSALESGSCWNEVVGPAVVVNGFPLPKRGPEDRGLEVSISVMASLAGLPQAVTFGGGFVFKGQYHALVPIRGSSESIQWHLINTYPKRLRWIDIDKSCPGRLRGEVGGDAFWQKRSFLGWCPRVIELLGTAEYDYESVQCSKAHTCSRRLQLDKVTVGFSQWAQITGEFTLGKKDGFRRPNDLDDYEILLDDAKNMHVILHDTAHRRAYQTNGEELILHLIHHRKKLDSPRKMSDLEFADADRRAKSTRQVMHNNSEKVLHTRRQISSSALKEHRFKEEVKLLYSTLDGLRANIYPCEGRSLKLGRPFKLTASTSGWEYMEVVRNCRRMSPKTIELRKTCGRWNDYAKDIEALVLFGANFGDILKPTSVGTICSTFSSLPRNECYLAVRADALKDLFDQQGSPEDQAKLTPSGYTLNGSRTLYRPCYDVEHRRGPCIARRMLQIVKRSIHRNALIPLQSGGAVIIGETKTGPIQNILHREQDDKQTYGKPQCQHIQPSTRASRGPSTKANHQIQQKAFSVELTKAVVQPGDSLSVKSPDTSSDYEYIAESSTFSNSQWGSSLVKPTSNVTSVSSSWSSSGPSKITRDLAVSNSSSNHSPRINTDGKCKQPIRAIHPDSCVGFLKVEESVEWEISASAVCVSTMADKSLLPHRATPTIESLGKRESVTAVPPDLPRCLGPPAVNGNLASRKLRRQPKFSSLRG